MLQVRFRLKRNLPGEFLLPTDRMGGWQLALWKVGGAGNLLADRPVPARVRRALSRRDPRFRRKQAMNRASRPSQRRRPHCGLFGKDAVPL